MRFGQVVRWGSDVLPAWQRAAHNGFTNPDVWGVLPDRVCWISARVETSDISKMYVIGSPDWKDVFGTYRVEAIAAQAMAGPDDQHRHKSRIIGIGSAYSEGFMFEKIAMVASSGEGPFVVINGNHRAVGSHRVDRLVGLDVFVGLHADMESDYQWFRWAVGG